VLWSDYFKPEHLEAHPDLHDRFWKALKQAGTCKRSVDAPQRPPSSRPRSRPSRTSSGRQGGRPS
jgi:hypothetical protein